MTILRRITGVLFRWLDIVAATVVAALGWFISPRVVQFIEEDDSSFKLRIPKDEAFKDERIQIVDGNIAGDLPANLLDALKGNRIELILRPSRFLFRPLELPRRAAEFLDGIVRAQIDRLTPWSANDAVFGWGRPTEVSADRISVMVVATARAIVRPYLQLASTLGAAAVSVFTVPNDASSNATGIKVFEQKFRGALDTARVAGVLLTIFLITGAAACLATGVDVIIGGNWEAEQLQLARRIADRRGAIRNGQNASSLSASAALDRRKHETAASVIVLDVLSQILPDHTYLTELRVEGNKLQIVGVTRDAPELIRLIERSRHFTRATFFAPTTRSPSDTGERFHIETRIEPVNTPAT